MLLTLVVANLFASEIILKDRELPKRFDQCHFCHISRETKVIAGKTFTDLEHKRVTTIHGNKKLECNHCHDKGNHDYLVSPANFKNSSPVCRQCHMETFRDYAMGIHGKRIGGWMEDKTRRYHCIDCHNPHDVKFKKMEAFPPPHKKSH